MGEDQGTLFSLDFNRSIQIQPTSPENLTLDAGALLLRDVGERLGLWSLLERSLFDPRNPALITHPFIELLRTLMLVQAQGWSSQRDVDFLRLDPALRLAVSERKGQRPLLARESVLEPEGLASQPTLSRLMATLSAEANRAALVGVLRDWAAHRVGVSALSPLPELTLDLDSLPIEVYGHQDRGAYSGHYGINCFHPLILRWEFGDFLGAELREGNLHTSNGALDFMKPYLDWAQGLARRVWLRMDAGFPAEPMLAELEERDHRYVARLKKNPRLDKLAWPHVDRVADTANPQDRLHMVELTYQADPWSRARRVVLVIDECPSELMPRYFFLVTNAPAEEVSGEALLERYRKRGAAEKDFGEWQNAVGLTLSSTNRLNETYLGNPPQSHSEPVDSFAVNEAAVLVSLVSANLLHAGSVLAKKEQGRLWSRGTFRKHVLKAAARVTRSARYVRFRIPEKHAEHWRRIGGALKEIPQARGSPILQVLPSPA